MSMETKHPLGALIRTTRMVNGWSQREVADRAKRFGHKLSDSNVSALEAGPVQSVSIKQVKALAQALDLPERQILNAYLGSMGYAPESAKSATVEEAIRGDGRLSSEDRKLLLTMVEQMRSRNVTTAPPADPQADNSWRERASARQDVKNQREADEAAERDNVVRIPERRHATIEDLRGKARAAKMETDEDRAIRAERERLDRVGEESQDPDDE